jgi:antitoxin component YwqK of YwqJK toxin-antitoxin module
MVWKLFKNVGYKKACDNRIVVLEILGKNNENRKSIVNRDYAKMRCSEARVLDIYSIDDFEKKFTEAKSLHNADFIYRVGEIVRPLKYNSNIETVCGGGIHYFLSREAAIGYGNQNMGRYTGESITADDSGKVLSHYYYKNGQPHGRCTNYDHSGSAMVRYYDNGILYEPGWFPRITMSPQMKFLAVAAGVIYMSSL